MLTERFVISEQSRKRGLGPIPHGASGCKYRENFKQRKSTLETPLRDTSEEYRVVVANLLGTKCRLTASVPSACVWIFGHAQWASSTLSPLHMPRALGMRNEHSPPQFGFAPKRNSCSPSEQSQTECAVPCAPGFAPVMGFK